MTARVLEQRHEFPLKLDENQVGAASPEACLAALPTWRASTPRAVQQQDVLRDGSMAWRAWQKRLRRAKLAATNRHRWTVPPLLWCLPAGLIENEQRQRIARLCELSTDEEFDPLWTVELKSWLADQSCGALPNEGDALEALAWCGTLPAMAQQTPAEHWWELLQRLHDAAADAAGIDPTAAPLVHQLLAGELPLSLAASCRDIQECWQLRGPAVAALTHGLSALLDDEGFPQAGRDLLQPLVACWTRCRLLSREVLGKTSRWSKDAAAHFGQALRHCYRLARADGSALLERRSEEESALECFAAAARQTGLGVDRVLAAAAFPLEQKRKHRLDPTRLPKRLRWPAVNHERLGLAVLRGGWDRRSPKLAVRYVGAGFEAELEVGGETLFAGDWLPRVSRGGQGLVPAGDWHCSCWVSDADGEYFEAELPLSDGARLQRQIMLAREDECLFVADAVLCAQDASDPPRELEYSWFTPLTEGVRFEPAAETCEGLLVGRKPRAVVMPLALPEWRVEKRFGALATVPRGLELRQSTRGFRLFAPLFFDLAEHRLEQDRTWRQLTVGRDLTPVPRDEAVAFRVQIGKRQWAAYRSLTHVFGRSYLGQHTFYEFVLGRFNRKGKLQPLIEIE